jgi:hypothetical protein
MVDTESGVPQASIGLRTLGPVRCEPLRSAIRGVGSSEAGAGQAHDRKVSGVSGRFRARTPVAW